MEKRRRRKMKIRPAKLSDYGELMKLYGLFVGDDRFSNKTADSFKKVLQSTTSFIYIAEKQSKLIGFVAFSIKYVVRYPKPIGTLDEMYVLEQYRNQGIGKNLMEILEKKLKKLNCYGIFMESGKDLKTAHIFYEKLGYKKYGYYFAKVFT
jgi:ribosomal protein S18 acetylase RimI-like enzyme